MINKVSAHTHGQHGLRPKQILDECSAGARLSLPQNPSITGEREPVNLKNQFKHYKGD